MIIKLVGADFSANNIGTIAVNREVSESTKTLLANYTRNLTKSQQFAVQDFISGLKSNGLWIKIENLFIPALANSLTETMYNVKQNKSEQAPSSNYYELVNYGLKTKELGSGTEIPTDKIAKFYVNGSYMNCHYMVYAGDTPWNNGSTYYEKNYEYMTSYNSSAYRGLRAAENEVNNTRNFITTGNPDGYAGIIAKDDIGTGAGFIGLSVLTSGYACVFNNKDVTSSTGTKITTDTTMTNVPTFIGTGFSRKENCHGSSMRIISTGSGLTVEELKKYNELCDALIASICA